MGNYEIKGILKEISNIKIEKRMQEIDKLNRKKLKKLLLNLSLATLTAIGIMTRQNMYTVLGCGFALTVSAINNSVQNKRIKSQSINIDIPDEQLYTENYQQYLEEKRSMSDSQKKYEQAARQQQKMLYQNVKQQPLDKQQSLSLIAYEVDAILRTYNLPPLTITNDEWDIYFDTIYDKIKSLGMEENYYKLAAELVRYIFAKAYVEKVPKMDANHFINNLCYLQVPELDKKDIEQLQKQIRIKMLNKNTIDIRSLVKQRKRK